MLSGSYYGKVDDNRIVGDLVGSLLSPYIPKTYSHFGSLQLPSSIVLAAPYPLVHSCPLSSLPQSGRVDGPSGSIDDALGGLKDESQEMNLGRKSYNSLYIPRAIYKVGSCGGGGEFLKITCCTVICDGVQLFRSPQDKAS
jgi:hypothetical protein